MPTLPNQRTGRENARYELDTVNPYHGRYAFRLRGPSAAYFKLCPQHDRPMPYVWSAWMRTDGEEATVQFRGAGLKNTTFKLTAQWQRYHVVLTMPRHAPRHNAYFLVTRPGAADACVWVDAMQFEQGTEPTEFEP